MSDSNQQLKDVKRAVEDEPECRLYVGNLDYRISESSIIKMFSCFGKIISEDFLMHKRGPKRGEPRGYAFVQYSTKEEAQLAKSKMNGRLFFGRPIVVRLASEKTTAEGTSTTGATSTDTKLYGISCSKLSHMDKDAKIAAIKKKLKSLEGEGSSAKKQRTRN
ncbi:putative RNA-binding protein 18 [Carex littledalei]|uniref:Probable RNA-binding protein 18 n=1 Tax=Carex littledalei TaxID=544730 RepID=A0A833QJ63_9POAL|nr:putative RNA-binding protein 18 [Carex littledalei]